MRCWLCMLIMGLLWLGPSARADDKEAKQQFAAGVALAAEQRWQEAATQLEASLKNSDKPATRFNLVLVYHELGKPLELARHALVFLDAPDSSDRVEAKQHARSLLSQASERLSILTTEALPSDVTLQVDGAPPALHVDNRVYLLPGMHRLDLKVAGGRTESIKLQLGAGQTMPWPRLEHEASDEPHATPIATAVAPAVTPAPVVAPAPAPAAPPRHKVRTGLAWGLGLTGAALGASALGVYLAADERTAKIERGFDAPGYISARREYLVRRDVVLPLALGAGVTLLASVLVAPRVYRARHWGWAVASLVGASALITAGTLVMTRGDERIDAANDAPSLRLQSGSLLLSAALPALAFGVVSSCGAARKAKVSVATLPLQVRW